MSTHNGRDPDAIPVDHFEPDYKTQCINCGQTPTVVGVSAEGEEVFVTEMCGPCTFGTAAALDPDWWNHGDD